MGTLYLFPRQSGKKTLCSYIDSLSILKKEESEMQNPPLKDWLEIRNKIRTLERKIKELKHEKID